MSLQEVEAQYGKRPTIPMTHGETLLKVHARGETADGQKFVWCPVGYIMSWHPDDYDHKYCAWCKEFYAF